MKKGKLSKKTTGNPEKGSMSYGSSAKVKETESKTFSHNKKKSY